MAKAIDTIETKVNSAISAAVLAIGDALASTVDSINEQLSELGGSNANVGTINVDGTSIAQNASPSEAGTGDDTTTGTGVPDPETGVITFPTEPDPTGGGSTTAPRPGPGSVPPPGGTLVPTGGGDPTGLRPPPVEAPPPPDCGVVILQDPCSKKTKIITCKPESGGDETTTPEGEPQDSDEGTGEPTDTEKAGGIGLQGGQNGGLGLNPPGT